MSRAELNKACGVFLAIVSVGICSNANAQKSNGPPDPDYVETPVGFAHKDCIFEVQDDEVIVVDPTNTSARIERGGRGGTLVKSIGRCSHPTKGRGPRMSDRQPQDGSLPTITGWVEASFVQAPNQGFGAWWKKGTANWTVPKNPKQTVPTATVFLFNSFETSGFDAIIQPVLQFGPSAAGGGAFWGMASWYLDSFTGGVFFSVLKTTSAGHSITGTMTASGCNSSGVCTWTIKTIDNTAGVSTVLSVFTPAVWTWAQPAVLEVGAGNPVTSCDQFPNQSSTTFSNISIQVPGANNGFIDATLISPWQTVIWGGDPWCNYMVTNSNRNSTLVYH